MKLKPITRDEWLMLAEVAENYPPDYGFAYFATSNSPQKSEVGRYLKKSPENLQYG